MIQQLRPLPPEVEEELAVFSGQIADHLAGRLDEEAFRGIRLRMGIYGQRQPGYQMIRVKIPWGGLRSEQLHALARIVDTHSTGWAHLTTRQDIQFHWVRLHRVPEVLRELAEAGLTTREACGNTVRNVTACHWAGVSRDEVFDVTPTAAAISRHFLRNPLVQSLPRKFKIAFDGCPSGACAGLNFHDIGGVAELRDGRRGFRLYIAGGLGNTPREARRFEDWTPEEEVLRLAHAILVVFDRDGNRKNRNRARLKFLIDVIGWDEFRRRVEEERAKLPPGWRSDLLEAARSEVREDVPETLTFPEPEPDDAAFRAWRDANVRLQRQDGFAAISVLAPIGDLNARQLHAVAKAAALYGDGHIRATREQNLLLRWVRAENLPALWRRLRESGLAEAGAGLIHDITSCPGADTCNLGITSSRGLARALRQHLLDAPELSWAARDLTVKISGCPNSCGQHHIADVGFHGSSRKVGAREIPAYVLLVGGGSGPDDPFARPLLRVPAKRAPDAFRRLVEAYAGARAEGERFRAWAAREGHDRLRARLAEFEEPPAGDEDIFVDWTRTEAFAAPKGMKGECAR